MDFNYLRSLLDMYAEMQFEIGDEFGLLEETIITILFAFLYWKTPLMSELRKP